jgi:hypothetical protein
MIANTVITGNTASVVSPNGVAGVTGSIFVANFTGDSQLMTIQNRTITANNATASSTTDSATVQGAGVPAINPGTLQVSGVED